MAALIAGLEAGDLMPFVATMVQTVAATADTLRQELALFGTQWLDLTDSGKAIPALHAGYPASHV